MRRVCDWLRPQGELFLVNDAIYRTIFKPLIPLCERRIAAATPGQGCFADVRSCIPQELDAEQFPKAMNFLDPTVLQRELGRAGFEVVALHRPPI